MTNSADKFRQASEALSSASTPAKQTLERLVAEYLDNEEKISNINELLKSISSRQNELKTKSLPDAMAAVGSALWKNEDGLQVELDDFVAGSLPKDPDDRQFALDWLEKEGGAELIKSEVSLIFGKSEHNLAISTYEALKESGLEPVMQSAIHPQTYLKFIREKLKAGANVPVEQLKLFVGRQAKVSQKRPKKRLVQE